VRDERRGIREGWARGGEEEGEGERGGGRRGRKKKGEGVKARERSGYEGGNKRIRLKRREKEKARRRREGGGGRDEQPVTDEGREGWKRIGGRAKGKRQCSGKWGKGGVVDKRIGWGSTGVRREGSQGWRGRG
jgi:hypothetical protein